MKPEIAIQQVLFGYRARVVHGDEVLVDYCCGPDAAFAALTATVMQRILDQRGLAAFPAWRVRPIYREPSVVAAIWQAAGLPGAAAICQEQLANAGYEEEQFLGSLPWRLR